MCTGGWRIHPNLNLVRMTPIQTDQVLNQNTAMTCELICMCMCMYVRL